MTRNDSLFIHEKGRYSSFFPSYGRLPLLNLVHLYFLGWFSVLIIFDILTIYNMVRKILQPVQLLCIHLLSDGLGDPEFHTACH